VYDTAGLRTAVEEFRAFAQPFAWSNALGHKLVQLGMPGIPDVYQGTEFWDDSLVDPDNRRAVDFGRRADTLTGLPRAGQPVIAADGAAKLHVVSQTLRLRRERPDAFAGYSPVDVTGAAAEHALAFDRGGVVVVATRLPIGLADKGGWADTRLALSGSFLDRLSGRTIDVPATGLPVAELLEHFPVALLEKLTRSSEGTPA
jgi:(1->4)-alpha-D-glucan 1-alpha-D-glucosylmutase